MSEIKPTPGPWELWGHANPSQVISSPAGFVAQTLGNNDKANARLIAEAGTVFHHTGLSPVQLVEMVKELKAASKHCEDLLTSHEINRVNGEELADTALAMLRAALAKCEGVKP